MLQNGRLFALLLLILPGGGLFAQPQYTDWEETPGTKNQPVYLAQANPNTGGPAGNAATSSTDLGGFADTPWKSTYSEVKARFEALARSTTTTERVEILNAVRNKSLLIRRNDVKYHYTFYKTPFEVVRLTDHQITREDHDQVEAVLFHVKVTPVFLESTAVENKIAGIYGPKSGSTFDEKTKRGANIWSLPGGFIFQWHEPYRNTPYTRTMDYISRDLAEKIIQENGDYFDAKEKQILKDLIVG